MSDEVVKLRSAIGSKTTITEGPAAWPEQSLESGFTGASKARSMLAKMGVNDAGGSSSSNGSASGEYGGLELRPGIVVEGGAVQIRSEPVLFIRQGERTLKLARTESEKNPLLSGDGGDATSSGGGGGGGGGGLFGGGKGGSLFGGGDGDDDDVTTFPEENVTFESNHMLPTKSVAMNAEAKQLEEISALYWTSVRQGWPAPHESYRRGVTQEWLDSASVLLPQTAKRMADLSSSVAQSEKLVAKYTKQYQYEDAIKAQGKLEGAIDRIEVMRTLAQWVLREVAKENAALQHLEEQRDFARAPAMRDHIAKVVQWAERGFGDLTKYPKHKFMQKMRQTRSATTRTVVQERSSTTMFIPLSQVVSIEIVASTKETMQHEKVESRTLEVDGDIEVHAAEEAPPQGEPSCLVKFVGKVLLCWVVDPLKTKPGLPCMWWVAIRIPLNLMSGIKDILVNICKKGDAPVTTKEEMGEGLFRDVDTMLVDQVFYEKDAFVPIVLELPPTIIAKITWSPYTERFLTVGGGGEKACDEGQPQMGWNQIPMTPMHIEALKEADMIQTIEVPVDVAMTAKCVGGRFVAARPDRRSDSLFTRHGGDAAVKDGVATISALKAGLALHFRRQVNEMHENYRAALNDIPRYAEVMEADGFLLDYQPPAEDAEETPPTGTCQNIYNKIIGAWNGINGTCWTTLCKCLGDSPYAAVAEEPDQAPAGAKVHIKDHGVYDARLKKDIDEHFNSELNRLRSDLEQALMRLSQPAAEATWQTTEELEELAFAIVRMKSLIGGCVISGFQSSGKFLPELVWNSIMPGVRTSFQPIAIDLTPIDTQLNAAITSKHGGDRFPGDGNVSFYERAQQLLAEKNHLRAHGTSSADEMQQIVQMLESQGLKTEQVTLHANPMSSGRGRERGDGTRTVSGSSNAEMKLGNRLSEDEEDDPPAWVHHESANAAVPEETRLADGLPYTQAEFVEHYGGLNEWHAAGPPSDHEF